MIFAVGFLLKILLDLCSTLVLAEETCGSLRQFFVQNGVFVKFASLIMSLGRPNELDSATSLQQCTKDVPPGWKPRSYTI